MKILTSVQMKEIDRKAIAARGLGYEQLDQLTTEIILGVR